MSTPLLLILSRLAAPDAWAQSEEILTVETSEVQVFIPSVTELTEGEFRGLDIDGELVRPAGILDVSVVHRPLPSWIALRTSFDPELQASLDEIR